MFVCTRPNTHTQVRAEHRLENVSPKATGCKAVYIILYNFLYIYLQLIVVKSLLDCIQIESVRPHIICFGKSKGKLNKRSV